MEKDIIKVLNEKGIENNDVKNFEIIQSFQDEKLDLLDNKDLINKSENEENELEILSINSSLNKKYICYWDPKSKNAISNDYEFIDKIFYLFRICSYGFGTPKYSRRQNKLLIKPFVLNCYDTLYLYDK